MVSSASIKSQPVIYSLITTSGLFFLPALAFASSFVVPTNDHDGTYTVSWNLPNYFEARLEERVNSGPWTIKYGSPGDIRSGTLSYTDRAVGTYAYRLTGCNPGAGGPGGSWDCNQIGGTKTVTVFVPTSPPSTFSVPSSDTNGAYSVSWSAVTAANAYTLQERVGSGSWSTIQNSSSISRSISGKSNGTYSYRVRACNGAGCSSYSTTKSTTVLLPPSAAPSSFSVPSSDNNGSYSISWSAVSTATTYTLQEKVGSGSWSTLQNSASRSRSISDKPNGIYSYRIRACNSSGCSSYSSHKSTTVLWPPASAPGTFTVPASDSDGSYSVSWSAVPTATIYTLQEKVGSGSWSTIHNTSTRTRSLSGKINDTYSYRVRACNGSGCSGYSATKTTTVNIPIYVPTGMSASPSSSPRGLVISWNAIANAQRYEVARSVDGGSTWDNDYYNGSITQFTDTDIDNHPGAIRYKIRACHSVCSAWTSTPASL